VTSLSICLKIAEGDILVCLPVTRLWFEGSFCRNPVLPLMRIDGVCGCKYGNSENRDLREEIRPVFDRGIGNA
jgi:hypothetical protein